MSNTNDARKNEELREAFRCLVSLANAKPKNNKMSCSVYVPLPGEKLDDEEEAQLHETASRVRIYLESWVIPVLEQHLGFNEQVVKEIMERQHEERFGKSNQPPEGRDKVKP